MSNKISITIAILVILGVIGMVFFLNSGNKQAIIPSIATTPTVNPTGDFQINGLGNSSQTAPQQQSLQTQATPPTSQEMATEKASPSATEATIKTSKGDITIQFYGADAPNTVENFVKKAKSGFYDNLTFHRVEDWVIQGGDPKGDGTGGGQMPTELNDKPFVTGSVGVARGGDINVSNDSQFFITKEDASWLNNQYTNFGIVTDGMEVVNKIAIGDKILSISVQ
jgi:peptidyl-prolyl cis-trans isomerase B (cyclophilin B)